MWKLRTIMLILALECLIATRVASAQNDPAPPAATPESVGANDADALAAAYKTAIDARDIDGRLKLHYWVGTNPKDARSLRQAFEGDAALQGKVIQFAVTKLEGVERTAYAESVLKDGNGRKPNLDPIARMDITVEMPKSDGTTQKSLLAFPVGEKDGRFYIVGYLAKAKK